jgi:hypothetical protein
MDRRYSISWGFCPVALIAKQNVLRETGIDRIDFQITLDDFFHACREQLNNTQVINAQNAMFEKAMVLCQDTARKILFEDADIARELDEKQYYFKMLYYV